MHTKAIEPKALARRRSLRIAFAFGLVGFAPLAFPQAEDTEEDDVFELSPFEVTGDEDTGYRASSTLAGTRIRTDLKDVGSAISVYTEEFLKDIGATDNGSLLQYTTNAEVSGTQGTYLGLNSAGAIDDSGTLRNPVTTSRIRGLSGADNTRDYFGTDIPWDSYAVNRVDIQRGANSMLFGLGSPAGIVNATFDDAAFADEGKVELRFGSYGSLRTSVNLNRVLLEDQLAFRVAALRDAEKYKQDPAFEDDTRLYAAVRWEPIIGSDGMKTTVRAKYENGDINANRPRNTPPLDSITAWYRPLGYDANSNPLGGLGKWTSENPYDTQGDFVGTPEYGWVSAFGGQQSPFFTFDGASGQMYDAKMGPVNLGAIQADGSVGGAAQSLAGRRYAEPFFGLNSLSGAANTGDWDYEQYGLYRRASLLDPTVFDFNNQLIDGQNKSEWGGWDALNLDLSQTFLNNRIGVNLTYDKQDYNRGGQGLLDWGTAINVDITQTFQDGTANPNLGRPFITTGGGGGSDFNSSRENKRASVFAELRASDVFESDSLMTKILGKHLFNFVSTEEEYAYDNLSWRNKAADQAWQGFWNGNDGSTTSYADRAPTALIYLDDSVAGRSSASGANINRLDSIIDWRGQIPIQTFETIWNAPAGVSWDDPWVGPMGDVAMSDTPPDEEIGWQQRSNPANYVGWTRSRNIGIRSYDNGADPGLITGANKTEREIKSLAATWQGHLWNESLVGTFGWRKDEVKSRSATANNNNSSTSTYDLSPETYFLPDYDPDDTFEDQTTSWGAVLHLNKILENDPLPIDVSLSYNESSNFQVGEVRRDIYAKAIANPSGDTNDLGITLATKDGKYSFRAIKYESNANNATAALGGTGNIGTTIARGLTWRNVFLYKMDAYDYNRREIDQSNAGRAWLSSVYGPDSERAWAVETGSPQELALEDQMIEGWNQIQRDLDASGFLDAWGITNIVSLDKLTNRSTYLASLDGSTPPNAAAQYTPDVSRVRSYGSATPANLAVTADVVSKGYEFELTANPIENLRLSFNASKSEVVNSNVGGDSLTEFVEYLEPLLRETIVGEMPMWGGYNPITTTSWNGFMSQYTLMKLQEGTSVAELRKWRYNVVANYNFSDGRFKGLGIGGSYRWQDKVAIGYPLIPLTQTTHTFDLDNPIYGPSEDFIDLWASYSMPLSDKIDWKIQLNIRNAFADDKLIPIAVQPDKGFSIAGARIAPTQEWFITNTFSF